DALRTDLQAPAPATYGDECRRAPARSGTARGDPATVLATTDERAFDHVGHNCDALGIVENFLRDALVRCGHDFVQHFTRICKAVDGVITPSCPRETTEAQHDS